MSGRGTIWKEKDPPFWKKIISKLAVEDILRGASHNLIQIMAEVDDKEVSRGEKGKRWTFLQSFPLCSSMSAFCEKANHSKGRKTVPLYSRTKYFFCNIINCPIEVFIFEPDKICPTYSVRLQQAVFYFVKVISSFEKPTTSVRDLIMICPWLVACANIGIVREMILFSSSHG